MKTGHTFKLGLAWGLMLLPLAAQGFGGLGHRAIAEAARELLTKETRAAVTKILGNDDLAAVATWMDEARNIAKNKSTTLTGDALKEAEAFNQKHPGNDQWHFVNLPVGAVGYGYDPAGPYARKDDIVHALRDAIDVLEGKSPASAADYPAKDALRVLVHLAGDIHQPLHTVAGYYDVTKLDQPALIRDPAKAVKLPKDLGGNRLIYAVVNLEPMNLHSLLDSGLMDEIVDSSDGKASLKALLNKVRPSEAERTALQTPGAEPREWSALWANDSATVAVGVYEKLTFGEAKMDTAAPQIVEEMRITLPDDYETQQASMIQQQLRKAAVHLAQLLNAIRWAGQ